MLELAEQNNIFFTIVNDSQKIHNGGGINDEQIELFFLDENKIDDLLFDESKAKTPGLMFSLYWF